MCGQPSIGVKGGLGRLVWAFTCVLVIARQCHASSTDRSFETTATNSQREMPPDDQNTLNSTTSTSTYSQCGGIIRQPNQGSLIQIAYKANENVRPNEFCSWVISVNRVNSYQIRLVSSNVDASRRSLRLTSLKKRSVSVRNISPSLGLTNMSDANILLVTFTTREYVSNQRGFTLYIYPGNATDNSVSSNSVHTYFNAESFFRHPSATGNYSDNEMSTFQLNAGAGTRKQTLLYRKIDLEGNYQYCFDYIAIFAFSPASGNWIFSERICGNVDKRILSVTGRYLLVFDSDISVRRAGFELAGVNSNC